MSDVASTALASPGPDPMHEALLESRRRWRQFGALATDLAFETDASGRFTFLAPEMALGWPAAELLGRPVRDLLVDAGGLDLFADPVPLARQPTWFRSRGGPPVCLAVSLQPLHGPSGEVIGARGVGVDITAEQRAQKASAASLRRATVLDRILGRLREEVMAPRMMEALIDSVVRALGAAGAAALDMLRFDPAAPLGCVIGGTGSGAEAVLPAATALLSRKDDEVHLVGLPDGTQVAACPCTSRFGDRTTLSVWRAPHQRPWDEDDMVLLGSVGGVMRMVMEHEAIQRELARQARTDPLTGLLNRRAFMEEAARRLDRLERDGLPATLLYMDLDGLKGLNDQIGHATGDEALLIVSALLLRTFRPTDLVARLGGDEFAVWLDGADSLTAAERAEALRIAAPAELAHLRRADGTPVPTGLSTGIAMRQPGSDEPLSQLLQRADEAMYAVKRGGRGHWRVSLQGQPA